MELISGPKAHGTRRRGGRAIGIRLKTRTDAFMTVFRRYFDEEMVKIIFFVSYEAGEGVKVASEKTLNSRLAASPSEGGKCLEECSVRRLKWLRNQRRSRLQGLGHPCFGTHRRRRGSRR